MSNVARDFRTFVCLSLGLFLGDVCCRSPVTMIFFQWSFGFFILFLFHLKDVPALRNVSLQIEPRIVKLHQQSTLRCSYDLQGAPLYSVKWYRGAHEFYRYTPTEHPSTKIFPVPGISVDINRSNSTQVVLRNIDFKLSGRFKCEVTVDEPLLEGEAFQEMTVVQLPESPPAISVGRQEFDYGDNLKANCSSPPSRPPADLKFVLNNITVAASEPITPRKSQEAAWSDLPLDIVLSELHFDKGRLILQCVAQVADIYREDATLELASKRNPVPEKVRAASAARTTPLLLILKLFICSLLFFR